jgi:hypothetical protein
MSSELKWIALLLAMAISLKVLSGWLADNRVLAQDRKTTTASGARNPYQGLRDQALQLKREKIGVAALSKPTEPWAAIMDWSLGSNTVTVVAIADGSASIYLSSGGGSIGGGQSHESIRKAAKSMVSIAGEFQPQMHLTKAYPLPGPSQITFYVLTDAGVFTVSVPETELSSHRSPLSKLGDAAQEIITQYRLVQESK